MESQEKDYRYKMRLIAPDLRKPGLAIYGIEKGKKLTDLIEERILTQQSLQEFGFVVIYDYDPGVDVVKGEVDIGTYQKSQFPHKDKDEVVEDVVTLRYADKDYERRGYTSVGHVDDIFEIVAQHLLTLNEEELQDPALESIIKSLREELRSTSLIELKDKKVGDSQIAWKDYLFEETMIHRYPQLKSLHEALKCKTCQHHSGPNILLVFDNKSMAHAGVYTGPEQKYIGLEANLLRTKYMWNDEGKLVVAR